MTNNELQQKWPRVKAALEAQYPQLSREDLAYEIGKEGELLERLQKKLGKNKEEINNWLSLMG